MTVKLYSSPCLLRAQTAVEFCSLLGKFIGVFHHLKGLAARVQYGIIGCLTPDFLVYSFIPRGLIFTGLLGLSELFIFKGLLVGFLNKYAVMSALDPVQYDQAVVVAVFFTGGKSFA